MAICNLCQEIVQPLPRVSLNANAQMNDSALEAMACVQHVQQRHGQTVAEINGAVTTMATWLSLRHFTLNAKLQDENDRATDRIEELVNSVRAEQTKAKEIREAAVSEEVRRRFDAEDPPHPAPGLPARKITRV